MKGESDDEKKNVELNEQKTEKEKGREKEREWKQGMTREKGKRKQES